MENLYAEILQYFAKKSTTETGAKAKAKQEQNRSKAEAKQKQNRSKAEAKQEQNGSKAKAEQIRTNSLSLAFFDCVSTVCRFRLFSFPPFLIDRCSNTSCSLQTILLQLVSLFSTRRSTFLISRVMMTD